MALELVYYQVVRTQFWFSPTNCNTIFDSGKPKRTQIPGLFSPAGLPHTSAVQDLPNPAFHVKNPTQQNMKFKQTLFTLKMV